MERRLFLSALGTGVVATGVARGQESKHVRATPRIIRTVTGEIPAEALGRTLPHEHVLVDFVGAAEVSPARYSAAKVFEAVVPHLLRARELGARALFECTPAFLGRDVKLLKQLSGASSLHLITNTGLYGARQNKFLPGYALTETAEQLAQRWIEEANCGIDQAIRPGFIKSGVDVEPKLSETHRKLVAAAALTHAATGLTIAVHTGRGPGLEQLDILREHGVAPGAFIWVHAQGAEDDALFAAADRGAWISLDGLNRTSVTRHLHLCRELKQRGHLSRMLLSHDAGWYDPAKPKGGEFLPYDLLFTTFLPLLRENGFTEQEVSRVIDGNPADAFAVRIRNV